MSHDIFVVEDNKTEGLLMKLALTGIPNAKITQFDTGEELVDALHQASPSIVITDLNLPGIQGTEVIEKVHQVDRNIRVIIVSATKDIETIIEVQEMGIDNFLIKSEGCLKYLRNVISDLLKLVELDKAST